MPPITDAQLDAFMSRVDIRDGCWIWTGGRNYSGYGLFYIRGRHARAHRVSYLVFIGKICDGFVLAHLCRVRECVNPDHLEMVTQRENLLRGNGFVAEQARRTHCPHGHPYVTGNVYVDTQGRRRCNTCRPTRRMIANGA